VAQPAIAQFGSTLGSVTPNSSLTLFWQAVGDLARIELVSAQGQVVQTTPVVPGPSGSLNVLVPGTFGRSVTYRLVVTRSGIDAVASVLINVTCTTPWFFGDGAAVPGSACAVGPAQQTDAAYQQFERGFMLAYTINGVQFVFGLTNDGRYIAYQSRWDGTTVRADQPPADRFSPQGVFNWAYYNTNAPIGSWASALGWAVTPAGSQPRSIQFEQSTQATPPFYADTPVNAVFYFSAGARDSAAGNWVRVR
jgi:hypothetical protein